MALNENIVIRLMADTSNYTTRMQAASAQAEHLGTALEKPMSTSQRFGSIASKTSLAVGALSAAIGVAAVKNFMDFDSSMSMVQANAGATGKELNKLRDAALEAGARTVYSATESADAINELAKAGMSASDILNGGLNGALDLAASDGMAVSEAAELMSSTLAQFNLKGTDATKVADALAAGAGKAQGNAKDLGYALGQSGMVANSFGISMEETTGTLASFAKAGMIGSDAGTSLKSMLIALANPSKKAQQTMDDLGISAYDAQGNFVGLSGLAGILKDKMGGLSMEQRNAALATIFGSDAVRAANTLYNQGADGIDSWTKAVSDSGFAAKQAASRNDNLKGDLEQLSGAVETMLIKIGSGANGPFRSIVQNVTNVINAFGSLDPKIQQSTVLVGMGIGAFAGLHKMFGNLSTSSSGFSRGMGLVLDPVQRFKTAIPQLNAGLGDLAAAARGPEKGLGLMANGMTRSATATQGLKSVGGGLLSMLGGPWGAAFTGAAIVLNIYAQKQAEAKARTQDMTSALQSGQSAVQKLMQNIASGNNTDWGWWQKMRSNAGSLSEALDKVGVSQKLFAEASNGSKTAIAQMNKIMDDYDSKQGIATATTDELRAHRDQATKAINEAKESTKQAAEAEKQATAEKVKGTLATAGLTTATGQKDDADDKAADSSQILGEAFGATNKGINDQAGALGEAIDALKTYYGFALSESDAEIKMYDSFDKASQAIAQNGATLDLNTEQGRGNQSALNDVAKSALDAAEAQARNGNTIDQIMPTIDDARNRFIDFAQKMGMSASQANALADQSGLTRGAVDQLSQSVNNVPNGKNVRITADTGDALNKIQMVRNDLVTLNDRTIRVTMNYVSTGEHIASGGSGGTSTKYATGGLISGPGTGTSDSIAALVSNGEYVMKADAVRALGVGFLDMLNYQRYADGGLVGRYERTPVPSGYAKREQPSRSYVDNSRVSIVNPPSTQAIMSAIAAKKQHDLAGYGGSI
jgi:TP901 family phage tail tape measure protein